MSQDASVSLPCPVPPSCDGFGGARDSPAPSNCVLGQWVG